jgi:hypothetical protein
MISRHSFSCGVNSISARPSEMADKSLREREQVKAAGATLHPGWAGREIGMRPFCAGLLGRALSVLSSSFHGFDGPRAVGFRCVIPMQVARATHSWVAVARSCAGHGRVVA